MRQQTKSFFHLPLYKSAQCKYIFIFTHCARRLIGMIFFHRRDLALKFEKNTMREEMNSEMKHHHKLMTKQHENEMAK